MELAEIVKLGAAAGAVATTYLFLRFWREDSRENRLMWGNHLSETVKTLQEIKGEQSEHRKRTEKQEA